MLKIGLLEDHHMVRQSFAHLLSLQPKWQVVEEYDCYQQLAEGLATSRADVMLVDISLPDQNGIEAVRLIEKQRPGMQTLVISMYEHLHYVSQAIEAGAKGYLSKRAAAEEMIEAVKLVSQGENYLSPQVAKVLLFNKLQGESKLSCLTSRERQMFSLLALGNSPKRIAQLTGTMPKTVLTHRASIYKKLAVASQFDLLRLGLKEGVFQLQDILS